MDRYAMPPLTLCNFPPATLVAGTTTTLTTTGTTSYCIKGKAYDKTAITNGTTPTTDATTGAAFVGVQINKGSVFVVGFDSAGAIKVSQGTIEALDASGNFVLAPQFPNIPDTVCPIGYIVIKVASNGSTWTFGSSNLSGVTGVTYTFVRIVTLPSRPQVA